MNRNIKIFLLLMVIILTLSFAFIWQVRDFVYQTSYDLFHENKPVDDKTEVDDLLASFAVQSLGKLDQEYKRISKVSNAKYAQMYHNSSFYIVDAHDIYKRIVGEIRIKNLLSRDEFYIASILNRSKKIYWRMDKRVLYKLLDLREELAIKGYDENGFRVRHGFRTPKHNEYVGGASKSRHIKGEAIDLDIADIDKNGAYTDEDKQIVLDILERKIIRDQGGIGKYPGTNAVHMDVRGYKARWDSY